MNLSIVNLNAQEKKFPKGHDFEWSLHSGFWLIHTPTIVLPLQRAALGGEFAWEWNAYGKQHWGWRCGYPKLGVALSYMDFGQDQLGMGIGLQALVSADFIKTKNWRIYGRLATGFAVINKPYHPNKNPVNNVIGSYLNNNTSFRLGASIYLGKHMELRPSASFTHYSNGASQFPNLGINILSFHMGFCYKFNPITLEELRLDRQLRKAEFEWNKRVQFCGILSVGYRESEGWKGPKYPIFVGSFDAGMYVARNNRLKLGIEYEYNASSHHFFRQLGVYDESKLKLKSSRVAAFIEDEILVGRFGINSRLGFYLTRDELQPMFMFVRLTIRYYFTDPYQKGKVAPWAGISLKAHMLDAEYYAWVIGVNF
ncbi:MAG: acyloxyacyl hydrolase [Saprospiraceae bacterium]|nr:acyloxyacyl hydrolase [Saprospiraceae bacterium]